MNEMQKTRQKYVQIQKLSLPLHLVLKAFQK